MATTYRIQIAMWTETMLARDVFTNNVHMQHQAIGGALTPGDATTVCNDIAAMYQAKFAAPNSKTTVKMYAEGPPPKYPFAEVTKGTVAYDSTGPRELALCLSFAKNRSRPNERGRIYLPVIARYNSFGKRPDTAQQNWALGFYSTANASFPDIGGVDWKFGVWSPSKQTFYASTEAWVDDEWDTVRSRGLQPSSRVTSVRDG